MTKTRVADPRTTRNEEIVELIRVGGAATQPRLITWDGRRARISRRTPIMDPTLTRAIRLPAGATAYGSTHELFTEVSGIIARVTRLSDDVVAQIAFFVFATWLADCLTLAPLLWIVAPSMASTSPLSQVLGLVCRQTLPVPELTVAALRSLPTYLKPTIVAEASIATRTLMKVIRATNRRGAFLVAGNQAHDLSCARIIFANEPLRDPAPAGFPLEIALVRTSEYVPVMDLSEAERVAAKFQGKFLMYRLANHKNVVAPNLNLSGLAAPTQELAQNLAACIIGDDELRSRIVPLLTPRDQELRVDRAELLESIVLEALLADCHDGESGVLPIIYLTRGVNTILAGRGETLEVSPEIVGWKLRALGLRSEFISGGRKGLALHSETRATIHRLAAAYGVRTLRQLPANNCSDCAALEMWQMPRTDAQSNSIEEST
ncbi:MAG: hypothetical protein WBL70_08690 [Candidatus Acidiferrales bacterium]